jgi:hypothetical protein
MREIFAYNKEQQESFHNTTKNRAEILFTRPLFSCFIFINS